ncbi:hypothetical protein ABW21_db0205834 [Orbilia brochopaga]|nr:hypothetical protein ABW21_db0205834 [Drechslerella brochopaga]
MHKRREFEHAKGQDPQAVGEMPWYKFSPPAPEQRTAKVAFRAGPPGISLDDIDTSNPEDPGRFNVNTRDLDETSGVPPPSQPIQDPSPRVETVKSFMSESFSSPLPKKTKAPKVHSYIAKCGQDDWRPKSIENFGSAMDGEFEMPSAGNAFGTPMTVLRKTPKELPLTTTTSEFIYGYSMCYMAMKHMRRTIHRLHIYTGLMRQGGSVEKENQLRKRAEASRIPVSTTMDASLLDAMSKGRPHNGFALEVEPLELPRITYLGNVVEGKCNAPLAQSVSYVEIKSRGERRHPFVLILDELTDAGNFGAILRSAYFLGVDAVLFVSQNSASPTAVMSRSSAGALEAIDLFDVGDLAQFITKSKSNGWKFFGAMPSPSNRELVQTKTKKSVKWYDVEGLNDPTYFGPVALVMGNEADGMRPSIQRLMDSYATIAKTKDADDFVDSLNVSVAASILCHAFVKPVNKGKSPEKMIDRKSKQKLENMDLAQAERQQKKNMMFEVDDGKYKPPNTALLQRGLDAARISTTDSITNEDPDTGLELESDEFSDDEEGDDEEIIMSYQSNTDDGDVDDSEQYHDEIEFDEDENEGGEDEVDSNDIEATDTDTVKDESHTGMRTTDSTNGESVDYDSLDPDDAFEESALVSSIPKKNKREKPDVRDSRAALAKRPPGSPPLPKSYNRPVLTKKQRKVLKKERKKAGIEQRKKVRDDKQKTTAQLNRKKDPPLLLHGKSKQNP